MIKEFLLLMCLASCFQAVASNNKNKEEEYSRFRKELITIFNKNQIEDIRASTENGDTNCRRVIDEIRLNPNSTWQMEADFIEAMYDLPLFTGDTALFLNRLNHLLKRCDESDNYILKIKVLAKLHHYNHEKHQIKQSVYYINQVEKELKRCSVKNNPELEKCRFLVSHIALLYEFYERAENGFLEVLDAKVDDSEMMHEKLHSMNNLAIIYRDYYHDLNRSDTWFGKIKEMLSLHQDYSGYDLWMAIVDGNIGKNMYLRNNYKDGVEKMVKAVACLLKAGDFGYVYSRSGYIAICYLRMGEIENAKRCIELADSCRSLLWDANLPDNQRLFLAKSSYYSMMGHTDLAASYLDSAIIDQKERKLYYSAEDFLNNIDKIGSDSTKGESIYWWAIFSGACILGASVIVWGKRKKKHDITVSKAITDSATNPSANESESTEQMLYSKIIEYIEESKCYLKPDVNLNSLAEQMGTNRSYVSAAINAFYGNFNSLINEYRIKTAQELLQKNPEMKMDELAELIGVKSRKSFYNAFKKVTGMSPSQYRDSIFKTQTPI